MSFSRYIFIVEIKKLKKKNKYPTLFYLKVLEGDGWSSIALR